MDEPLLDAPLLELTPGPTIELPPVVISARSAMTDAASAFAAVPDSALAAEWPWRGTRQEIRWGIYHAGEVLEAATAAVGRVLGEAGVTPPAAARHVAAATSARWDLHGLLAPLTDADLDGEPGGGEWTVRQTLAHIVNAQRAYAWFTAWWLARAGQPLLPRVPDDALPTFPDEDSEGVGTLADIRARLDAILDLSLGRLGRLDDPGLAVPARWSGAEVDVAFRLSRWASHIREHTIQVEKTLVMLERPMTEGDRLIRLVLDRYGILETAVVGLPAEALEEPGADGRTAAGIIAGAATEVRRLADEVAAAARSTAATPA